MGKIRNARLAKKLRIVINREEPAALSSLAFKSIDVIRNPLNTKNRSTPNPPSGMTTAVMNLPDGDVLSNQTPKCWMMTKKTAKARRVSSPLICFIPLF